MPLATGWKMLINRQAMTLRFVSSLKGMTGWGAPNCAGEEQRGQRQRAIWREREEGRARTRSQRTKRTLAPAPTMSIASDCAARAREWEGGEGQHDWRTCKRRAGGHRGRRTRGPSRPLAVKGERGRGRRGSEMSRNGAEGAAGTSHLFAAVARRGQGERA